MIVVLLPPGDLSGQLSPIGVCNSVKGSGGIF